MSSPWQRLAVRCCANSFLIYKMVHWLFIALQFSDLMNWPFSASPLLFVPTRLEKEEQKCLTVSSRNSCLMDMWRVAGSPLFLQCQPVGSASRAAGCLALFLPPPPTLPPAVSSQGFHLIRFTIIIEIGTWLVINVNKSLYCVNTKTADLTNRIAIRMTWAGGMS